ncbi:sigma-70 family RNA polymerase sigma factor [Streptomyces collinus]|uniref:RNA polymerase sigma factor SigL n=2 Tax=Streptomyces collinus TaxID=42684 RepID=S5V644_STRC3|nr:RNA polymerase sigma factor SigL [Streptomyces collinus Tu 365]UJA11843.1 sigma-70 family RNA polymerase sigma factor [Streptomyces collinus]UJA13291.1 sigma-70 family RNA polymerase sigma factor [Streptomyces collinus]
MRPFTAAIDRPSQSRARPLSPGRALRCDTAMTAGTSLPPGTTTAEHELAALQRDHGGPLFALLLRLSDGDRQRAEDLVQETLVRAWQHPEALRAADFDSVRPWLLTVARRLAIDARRARRARPFEVGDEVPENARVTADHAERATAVLDVREAVKTLTPEHRDVLVLVYFRGASVAEAATALGIPPGTVKSRAYYALRALRRVLPGYAADLR